MPIIRPITELGNNLDDISDICHKENEPVFITRNGKGDLVVMSMAHYERQTALFELYMKLEVAEDEGRACKERIDHRKVMAVIKKA
jgi:prevent-host-death family protein